MFGPLVTISIGQNEPKKRTRQKGKKRNKVVIIISDCKFFMLRLISFIFPHLLIQTIGIDQQQHKHSYVYIDRWTISILVFIICFFSSQLHSLNQKSNKNGSTVNHAKRKFHPTEFSSLSLIIITIIYYQPNHSQLNSLSSHIIKVHLSIHFSKWNGQKKM